jgi:hypothetical protein
MVLGFAILVGGALLLTSALQGKTIAEVIRGLGTKRQGPLFVVPELGEPSAAAPAVAGPAFAGSIRTNQGARTLVEDAVRVAKSAGGGGVYVGSSLRPGDITSSGNLSDHAANDAGRAARDIGVQGIDLNAGPPSPKLDRACKAICDALGRRYSPGQSIIDNFNVGNLAVEIIWRTPAYGGHMGHVHIGAHRA